MINYKGYISLNKIPFFIHFCKKIRIGFIFFVLISLAEKNPEKKRFFFRSEQTLGKSGIKPWKIREITSINQPIAAVASKLELLVFLGFLLLVLGLLFKKVNISFRLFIVLQNIWLIFFYYHSISVSDPGKKFYGSGSDLKIISRIRILLEIILYCFTEVYF